MKRRIVLQWPSRHLSPNARTHWTKRHQHGRAEKNQASWTLYQSGLKIPAEAELVITFIRCNRRKFDMDNALASLKWQLDGLARQSGVDDSGWSFVLHRRIEPEMTRHCVMVEWEDAPR